MTRFAHQQIAKARWIVTTILHLDTGIGHTPFGGFVELALALPHKGLFGIGVVRVHISIVIGMIIAVTIGAGVAVVVTDFAVVVPSIAAVAVAGNHWWRHGWLFAKLV